jgi:hypothetical protein
MTGTTVKAVGPDGMTVAELRHAIREARKRVSRGAASIAAAQARVAELAPTAKVEGASATVRREWGAATEALEGARRRWQRGLDLEATLTRQLAALPVGERSAPAGGRPKKGEDEPDLKMVTLRVPEPDVQAVEKIARQRYEKAATVYRRYVREGLERDRIATGGV